MKRLRKLDKIWIGIAVAGIAALAGPFGLAVGNHSHPVGHHSHPIPIPRIDLSKEADDWNTEVGQVNGYTVTATNIARIRGTVLEFIDTLPEGFQYLRGSTSGAITDDPVVDGRKLRWAGPFRINANSAMSFHFEVRVSRIPGRYLNVMDARVRRPFLVNGTGRTAPILVGVQTELFAQPALIKNGNPRLKFSARLTSRGRPLGGKEIYFSARGPAGVTGGLICYALTNANGVAECTGVVELSKAVIALGYEAAFEPWEGIYAPSSDHGDLIA